MHSSFYFRQHKGAIIGVSVLAGLVVIGLLFANGTIAKASANAGHLDFSAPTGVKQPIATYNNCASFIAAYSVVKAHIETHCWKDGESIGGMSWSESFLFTAPDAMKAAGTMCIQCPNKVIQYSDNSFDCGGIVNGNGTAACDTTKNVTWTLFKLAPYGLLLGSIGIIFLGVKM